MRVIIVDDELLLIHELKKMIKSIDPGIEISGEYTDPLEALRDLPTAKPDVAFLDIEMPDLNGVALAEKLQLSSPGIRVIFITAYNNYAAEAFSVNATDYLLKPIRPERLHKAMEKVSDKLGRSLGFQDLDMIKVQSFGKFGIYIGEKPIIWSRTKQKELFAYLLHHEDRWLDKYKICDDLWPGSRPEKALANLQTAIWAIRKILKSERVPNITIEYSDDSYILYMKDVHWDVNKYHSAYKAYKETGQTEAYDEAVELYKDGYLFYDDWNWAVLDREMFSQKHERLVRYYSRHKELE